MLPNLDHYKPDADLLRQAGALNVSDLHANVLYHGTGRYSLPYKARDKSTVTQGQFDVLDSILRNGLLPARDHISKVVLSALETISFTYERLYARVYAELFGQSRGSRSQLSYVFGESSDWSDFYMGETKRHAYSLRNITWIPRIIWNMATRFRWSDIGTIADYDHQRRRWLANQAEIPGNYPIVFGIENTLRSRIKLPYGLDRYELRCADPVPPEQIRFIETPESRVEETRALVDSLKLSTAIIPMEICEAYSYQRVSVVA